MKNDYVVRYIGCVYCIVVVLFVRNICVSFTYRCAVSEMWASDEKLIRQGKRLRGLQM